MGLGGAFTVLVVAEMMGVKAGLGWYMTWAQGWATLPRYVYAALIVMALMCKRPGHAAVQAAGPIAGVAERVW